MGKLYFNEVDEFCCDWITNLYPGSRIDRRDIRVVMEYLEEPSHAPTTR